MKLNSLNRICFSSTNGTIQTPPNDISRNVLGPWDASHPFPAHHPQLVILKTASVTALDCVSELFLLPHSSFLPQSHICLSCLGVLPSPSPACLVSRTSEKLSYFPNTGTVSVFSSVHWKPLFFSLQDGWQNPSMRINCLKP